MHKGWELRFLRMVSPAGYPPPRAPIRCLSGGLDAREESDAAAEKSGRCRRVRKHIFAVRTFG